VLGSNLNAVSVSSPLTISAIDDLHMEFGFSVVLVGINAAPSCASVAGTLNSVQSGSTTAVSIGFDPIDLNAPVTSIFSTIAVLALAEVRANASGTDGIDVGVDTGLGAGEIDVIFHTAAKKVEGCLCGNSAASADSPSTVCNARVAVSSDQIVGRGAVRARWSRRRGRGRWRRRRSRLVAAAGKTAAAIIGLAGGG